MLWVKLDDNQGICVGLNMLDDLDYADDGTLLPSDNTLKAALLERLDKVVDHLVFTYHGAKCGPG